MKVDHSDAFCLLQPADDRSKILSPSQIAKIRQLRQSGITREALAERFGVAGSTITRYAPRRDRICIVWTEAMDAAIEDMRLDGLPYSRIAEALGLSRCAVIGRHRRLRRGEIVGDARGEALAERISEARRRIAAGQSILQISREVRIARRTISKRIGVNRRRALSEATRRRDREIVSLRRAGMTIREAAAEIGIPHAAARSRYVRAMDRVGRKLGIVFRCCAHMTV